MYGTHDVRLEDKPVPEPGAKEVLVEIKAVGVCGSDVHYYEEGRIGTFVVEEPLILGHESSRRTCVVSSDLTQQAKRTRPNARCCALHKDLELRLMR